MEWFFNFNTFHDRVIHDVDQFIESLGNKCSSNNIVLRYSYPSIHPFIYLCLFVYPFIFSLSYPLFSDAESDLLVRVHVISFLCELATSENSQIFLDSFLSTFIDNIVEQVTKLHVYKFT